MRRFEMAEKRVLEKENVNPNNKKRLSLSLKKNRFASTSEDTLEYMSKYNMPKNSATSSKWALKNLSDWRDEYKSFCLITVQRKC